MLEKPSTFVPNIEQHFHHARDEQDNDPIAFIVWVLGGVGKTQPVLVYLWRYCADYTRDLMNIHESYCSMCRQEPNRFYSTAPAGIEDETDNSYVDLTRKGPDEIACSRRRKEQKRGSRLIIHVTTGRSGGRYLGRSLGQKIVDEIGCLALAVNLAGVTSILTTWETSFRTVQIPCDEASPLLTLLFFLSADDLFLDPFGIGVLSVHNPNDEIARLGMLISPEEVLCVRDFERECSKLYAVLGW
ncbi:hypothetical protein EJ05DRAFT_510627 [Pseudovirgaria hyperparasitica]|uniref:Uncharacterized protein n=1 Tax=Pseudovirgaria hyperparasitica TaxID=470096 RepID=A0A6A6W9M5_9PEZI|nr:uncharacterized protein EJ05DRAFT_510627 [Pseudovirgaria hyperparasitica]KAF2758734.1 hypothetical protein EJ05DRAFT_510627 [Pseudovirgaria hyperparasitica]